jgi:hypothetical protein
VWCVCSSGRRAIKFCGYITNYIRSAIKPVYNSTLGSCKNGISSGKRRSESGQEMHRGGGGGNWVKRAAGRWLPGSRVKPNTRLSLCVSKGSLGLGFRGRGMWRGTKRRRSRGLRCYAIASHLPACAITEKPADFIDSATPALVLLCSSPRPLRHHVTCHFVTTSLRHFVTTSFRYYGGRNSKLPQLCGSILSPRGSRTAWCLLV